ncbi:MAG: FIST C-terminal domain-containing protein [Gammaproteobacteria bacterium]|nr:FIST C-terminal domain-containing protein [Gammaproteobacteria bacterium]
MSTLSLLHGSTDTADMDIERWISDSEARFICALVAEQECDAVVSRLQRLARSSGIQLCGAVFPEVIYKNDFQKQGFVLVGYQQAIPYRIIDDINAESEKSISDQILPLLERNTSEFVPTLFCIFDAMIPNIGSLLDDIYSNIGDVVNYAGVNAGSETFQPILCIFDSVRFTQNAILALLLPTPHPAVLEHGYTAPAQTIVATAAEGNRITSIDWKPAFEVYAEQVKKHYDVDITKENFYENAVHFPFGIVRMSNEVLVRIPVALQDDGSLFCVGEVPENALLSLLMAEESNSHGAVDALVQEVRNQKCENFLLFYCAGRRMHMQNHAKEEVESIAGQFSEQEIVGALSLGEIGNSRKEGYPLFHNATLVSLPL